MIKSREKNSNTRQASRLFYVDGCIIDQRTALQDNRGRAPVRVHIEGFLQCGSVGRAWGRSKTTVGSERFQEMGTFPSKMAFPFVSTSVSPLSD